jgi:hypothetical protein
MVPPARGRTAIRLAVGGLLLLPAAAGAWPAIQGANGIVSLCQDRPTRLPDGAWSCHGPGGTRAGALVEVVRPGAPPGVRPRGMPPGAPYRYVPYPWGPPPRAPSGYDALDPWLGGSSDR